MSDDSCDLIRESVSLICDFDALAACPTDRLSEICDALERHASRRLYANILNAELASRQAIHRV